MSRTHRFDLSDDYSPRTATRERSPRQGRRASQGRARTGGYGVIAELYDTLDAIDHEISDADILACYCASTGRVMP